MGDWGFRSLPSQSQTASAPFTAFPPPTQEPFNMVKTHPSTALTSEMIQNIHFGRHVVTRSMSRLHQLHVENGTPWRNAVPANPIKCKWDDPEREDSPPPPGIPPNARARLHQTFPTGVLMVNGRGWKRGIGVLGPYHHSHSISALYGISPTHPGIFQQAQDPSKYRSYFGYDPERALFKACGHAIDEPPAPVTCGKWNAWEERSSCKSD